MRSFSLVLFATALAACSPFDPDLGGTSYKCGNADPKCPDGYTCQTVGTDQRCISDDGAGPDAPISGFQCAMDGALETMYGQNNDSTSTAYQLTMPSITLGPLSLCPAGDKDTYQLQIGNEGTMLEATVSWDSGMPVKVAIFGSGGQLFNEGTANGTNMTRAYMAAMPQGSAFVQVSAAPGVQNNYRVTIKAMQ